MKNTIRLALVASSALAAMAFFNSASASSPSSDKTNPRTLYIQNCSRCHGSNGKANTTLGKKLDAADLTSEDVKDKSVERIARTIKNGRTGMPAFGRKLTAAQISQLASYVKAL